MSDVFAMYWAGPKTKKHRKNPLKKTTILSLSPSTTHGWLGIRWLFGCGGFGGFGPLPGPANANRWT